MPAARSVTVVLDANVLYPFMQRDVLLSLASAGLFRARWTDAILAEWTRSLLVRKPQLQDNVGGRSGERRWPVAWSGDSHTSERRVGPGSSLRCGREEENW